jgi:hypothetical protein
MSLVTLPLPAENFGMTHVSVFPWLAPIWTQYWPYHVRHMALHGWRVATELAQTDLRYSAAAIHGANMCFPEADYGLTGGNC